MSVYLVCDRYNRERTEQNQNLEYLAFDARIWYNINDRCFTL